MARSGTSTRTSAAPASRPGSRGGKPEATPEDGTPPAVRRSGRARRPPVSLLADVTDKTNARDETSASPTVAKSARKSATEEQQHRRNAKRKAAPEVFDVPDDLLDKALAPMEPDELDEWEAWVELESDPAFFNVILKDLGVQHVKMQELFSVDEGSLSILPKPVHGLIFLYQYVEEDPEEPTEDGEKVWFANQTTNNACATLALFNIIMNAEDIELGDRLQAFKESSSALAPPLRGNLLCSTPWIRKVHNQFARRLDLLNADLALANSAKEDESRKRKATSAATTTARPAKRRRTKPSTDAAFHFIAYVPVGDTVYQLDGLEKAPAVIGTVEPVFHSDWTAVARPVIESRMLQYESEQLSFNLLALCRSPAHRLREALADNIVELARVQHATHRLDPSLGQEFPDGKIPSTPQMAFADFGLPDTLTFDPEEKHPLEIDAEIQQSPPDEMTDGDSPTTNPLLKKLNARRLELGAEQARLVAEYRAEAASAEDDDRRANGRKCDYTPFIHQWVRRLAEQGALQQIADEVALVQG